MHVLCNCARNSLSRSSKVVDFGTKRNRVCDFLLFINSILVLSCTVSEIRRFIGRVKIANFSYPTLI